MSIRSIQSKLLITRPGSLGIKPVISIKCNGAITPSGKLLGRRKNSFNPSVLSCYKSIEVPNISLSFQFLHRHQNLGTRFLLGGRIVTPCLADSPFGTADGPRRPCFNHSETEVRRSPPRADRRARPWPSPYAASKASTSPPPTLTHSLTISLSVHSSSPSRRHERSMSSSRSPAESASSPPWISNPPHPKLNHLPSFLLNLSNHSHNPHLAGNPGFPGRRLEFRPNLTSPWNSIARPPFLSSKSLNRR